MKIAGVYKITNIITGDFYIGSSKNVELRWANHKCSSRWKQHPNSQLYKDFQKYGLDKFSFQILATVEPEYLKQEEQKFIEMLKPVYNNMNANGIDVEKRREWYQSDKSKESKRKYAQSEKGKEISRKSSRKYRQTEKGKEVNRKASKKYSSQLCSYNNETLTLNALSQRFYKAGVKHPTITAKKYLLKN